MTTTCAYFSFTSLATDYFETRYSLEYNTAKNYAAGLPAIIVVFLFLFSLYTEKYGKKGVMLFTSGILSIIGYILIYAIPITEENKYIVALVPCIFIGIWFSIYSASYWSSISLVVPDHLNGIAFGITNTTNNIGMALYPILFGWLNTPPSGNSYEKSTLTLIIISAAGATFLFFVFIKDYYGKQNLHLSEKAQKEKAEAEACNEMVDKINNIKDKYLLNDSDL